MDVPPSVLFIPHQSRMQGASASTDAHSERLGEHALNHPLGTVGTAKHSEGPMRRGKKQTRSVSIGGSANPTSACKQD